MSGGAAIRWARGFGLPPPCRCREPSPREQEGYRPWARDPALREIIWHGPSGDIDHGSVGGMIWPPLVPICPL